MEVRKPKIPVSDEDVSSALAKIHEAASPSDQRAVVLQSLTGRSLTCEQASILLRAVKGGMQRMLAFEVIQKRLSDFPGGMPHISAVLSSPALDVAIGQASLPAPAASSALKTSMPSAVMDSKHASMLCSVNRLRHTATSAHISPMFHEELTAVFRALDLPPLPAFKPALGAGAFQGFCEDLEQANSAGVQRPAVGASAAETRSAEACPPNPLLSEQLPPGLPPLHLLPTPLLLDALQAQIDNGDLTLPGTSAPSSAHSVESV